MVATYSANLRLVEQGTGDNNGTWGTVLNSEMIDPVDFAIAGLTTITTASGTHTLTVNDGIADEARSAVLNVTSTLTGDLTIAAPAVSKIYIIANNSTGAHNVFINTVTPGTPLTIEQGDNAIVYCDGTNFHSVASALSGTASGPIDMNYLLFDRPSIKRYKEIFFDNGNQSAGVTVDYNNGNCQKITLTGNITITFTNFPGSGAYSGSMTLKLVQDATGSRTATFPAGTKTPGGSGLTLSTAANAVDIVYIYTDDDAATYDCAIQKAFS